MTEKTSREEMDQRIRDKKNDLLEDHFRFYSKRIQDQKPKIRTNGTFHDVTKNVAKREGLNRCHRQAARLVCQGLLRDGCPARRRRDDDFSTS